MNDNEKALFFAAVVAGVIAAIVGLMLGCYRGTQDVRSQAIQAGVAEYHCDPQTGVTEFRFLTTDKERKAGE